MPSSNDGSKAPSSEYGDSTSWTPSSARPSLPRRPWPALPAPLKHLFSKFPLRTLPPSQLPARTANHRDQHVLYIFTDPSGPEYNTPSFNPTCLKWQTYLKFIGLDFRTVASSNHASPTGALPFLMPASSSNPQGEASGHTLVVPSSKLQKWTREKGLTQEEPDSMRYEAYTSLLDHRIRRAWLYTLYLVPQHFHSIAAPLYIYPSTLSPPARFALSRALQAAALAELLSTLSTVSPDSLISEADEAFGALSTILGNDDWFFRSKEPGLFDASVFAYTYLLLDGMKWEEGTLEKMLRVYGNLVEHKDRIALRFYKSDFRVRAGKQNK
ncbi:hypothetical protein MMC26_000756 [Xylographa opegraphella]|nr:hypothetical protein [Xylographa opegraphella]